MAVSDSSRIYVMNPDGTGVKLMSDNDCIDEDLAWSPDGAQIVYPSCSGIAFIDVATDTVTHTLFSFYPHMLDWSPDGQWIAGAVGNVGADLVKFHPDGTGLTTLVATDGNQLHPSWSPDGSAIAFDDSPPGEDSEVAIVPAGGGTVTRMTDNTAADSQPSWAPAGDRIAFIHDGGLHTMAIDGSDDQLIPDGNSHFSVSAPDWQPARVALTPSRTVVDSGKSVQLLVAISTPGTTNPDVLVQRRKLGGSWVDVATVQVDGAGQVTLNARISTTTGFRARWSGDATSTGASSLVQLVRAKAVVKAHLFKHYATRGQWHLYHNGSRVWFASAVKPNRTGEKMCFKLQYLHNGHWRDGFNDCYLIRKDGTATIYVYNIPTGERGRLRATYPGAKDLLADTTPWNYYRIT